MYNSFEIALQQRRAAERQAELDRAEREALADSSLKGLADERQGSEASH